MESKIMATILNSKGVTAAYANPTPQLPDSQWACTDLDPDLFFPEQEQGLNVAKRVCAGCPQRELCFSLGQARAESGVWGGELLDRGKVLTAVPVIGRPRKNAA